jgi:hypothetical protein
VLLGRSDGSVVRWCGSCGGAGRAVVRVVRWCRAGRVPGKRPRPGEVSAVAREARTREEPAVIRRLSFGPEGGVELGSSTRREVGGAHAGDARRGRGGGDDRRQQLATSFSGSGTDRHLEADPSETLRVFAHPDKGPRRMRGRSCAYRACGGGGPPRPCPFGRGPPPSRAPHRRMAGLRSCVGPGGGAPPDRRAPRLAALPQVAANVATARPAP